MSIEVQGLHFQFGTHAVLNGVDFSAQSGALLAVLGPNGAGKSTLFRCVLGLLKGYTGTVLVDGDLSTQLSARELAHRIAYIPQSRGPAFHYTVLEMVLMGTTHRVSMLSAPSRHETEVAMAALARMGIADFAQKNFAKLSGGEQQLVLIARALAQRSKTLLLDEPTSALDYGNQAHVMEQVRSLADDGYTVMLSTHNPQHALWYADTVLALLDGKTAAFGAPEDVLDEALIRRLYGVSISLITTDDGERLIVPHRNHNV